EDGGMELRRSAGGLATGLRSVHGQSGGLWIGWSGLTTEAEGEARPEARRGIAERLRAEGAVAVALSEAEADGYYHRFSNGVLWPTLHDLPTPRPADRDGWALYRAVNERFADAVAGQLRPGDRVWVHDYHLMLVPRLLRERVPWARIGFFLHIPVPRAETLAGLPEWRELARGLLGADVVGVHTREYARSFVASIPDAAEAPRQPGESAVVAELRVEGRRVSVRACPMGIDVGWFESCARTTSVHAQAAEIRAEGRGPLFVGVDRLDYTKGIPQRLLAFERLLERDPALRGRARLIQVAVPSREDASGYADVRREVETTVARINARFGTVEWVPVEYTHASLDPAALVALYRAADVMLVTPLRDGLNLVAKEFVASRDDGDGVLVLSATAGSAAELGAAALLVDAADVERLTVAYRCALSMSAGERRVRMRRLREAVASNDIADWASRFLDHLSAPRVRARA
ncbi:MAG TPA: trehalose-6-phosphate synthase, partial [Gemmatimonadaceae bacterium]|nr:trehalose-6-phosphate synthase [Gemmatimonadaceae bacterium]